jgi:chromate transporter
MSEAQHLVMLGSDWLALFGHFLEMSLLSIGGTLTTAPDMHRFLVDQRHWLTDAQFNTAIAIGQAAPGPNLLFVALLGWQLGMNTGTFAAAAAGTFITMAGILLPSTVLTYLAVYWGRANRTRPAVLAFKQGMAPIVIALLLATAWILTSVHDNPATDWRLWLLTGASAWLIVRYRIHILWLLAAGAVLGAFGLV